MVGVGVADAVDVGVADIVKVREHALVGVAVAIVSALGLLLGTFGATDVCLN